MNKTTDKIVRKERLRADKAKKEARMYFNRQFIPLMLAVVLWMVANVVIHLAVFKDHVQAFFVQFTIQSVSLVGSLLHIPVTSTVSPLMNVDGFAMEVVMECTAYNFYIFVFFLSLLSPVKLLSRFITLLVFMGSVFVVNTLRFFALGVLGKHYPALFHGVHDYLWNILFGILVFLIWLWRYKFNSLKNEA
jgi:exosortase/archaeosortase family protein